MRTLTSDRSSPDSQASGTPRRTDGVGTAAAILCGAAWGSLNIVTKLSLRAGLDVPTLLAVRTLLSAVLLWMVVLAFGWARGITHRQAIQMLLLGLTLYALQSTLFNQALSRVPASIAVFGLYTYPTIVAVLALALGRERLGLRKAGALFLGLVGIALVLSVSTQGIRPVGVLFALASAVVWALFVITSQRTAENVHPVAFTSFIITGAAISLDLGALISQSIRVPMPGTWGWLVLSAVIPPAAVGALAVAVTRVGPTRATIGNTFDPPTTTLLGAVLLGERLSPVQLLGAALVVTALALSAIARPPSAAVGMVARTCRDPTIDEAIVAAESHP